MDIWQELYEKARAQYGPQEVSPFVYAHHVVCALESENGGIYTGFCIESCSGVMDLCAERVAALNMYLQSGQTVVRRLIAFRDRPPYGGGSGMPCGACREFFLQLSEKNRAWKSLWILRRAKRSGWSRWSPTGGAGSATSRQRKHSMYADGGRSFGSGLRPPLFCLKAQLPDKKA